MPWILVVDDDPGLLEYLARCLSSTSVRVVSASDGRQAVERLGDRAEAPPLVIVSDVVMPGMDGLTLRATLREDPRFSRVPVLLIGGEGLVDLDGPALRKPFNRKGLLAAVEILIRPSGDR